MSENGARPILVAFYTDADTVGGAEMSLGHLLHCLGPTIEPVLVGVHEKVVGAVAAFRPGMRTMVLPPVRDKFDVGPIVTHVRALRKLRPDICHANLRTPFSCQYGILGALTAPGVRTLVVEHLPMPTSSALRRWFKRTTSRRTAAHVSVGERSARLVEKYSGLPPGSVRTIYNGIPHAEVKPAPRFAEGPVVGYIGRLDTQKGLDTLVDAVAALDGVTLVLVGDGPQRVALEERARALALDGRFFVTGWITDARRHLPSFDVFALPSRFEGFPLVLLEAMLAGVPAVATPVGSVPESVLDGETGLLVPPDDAAELASALRRLLGDDELRTRMGATGRELVRRWFSAENMAAAYESLYRELTR